MRAWLLLLLLLAPLAHAQRKGEDAAIPYPEEEGEDERNRRELPKKSDATPNIREETEVEQKDREETLAHLDDPSIGLGAELVLGLMLLESSKGQGVQPQVMGGARITWEFSRTLSSDEYIREFFFADLMWTRTGFREGTTEIFADSYHDFFTLAPAFSYPLGKKSPIALFGQLGVGFDLNSTLLSINQLGNAISGTKFLFQYGIGLRGRPMVLEFEGGAMRVSFRIEATRFRRGYMDDTFFGGSVGVTF